MKNANDVAKLISVNNYVDKIEFESQRNFI